MFYVWVPPPALLLSPVPRTKFAGYWSIVTFLLQEMMMMMMMMLLKDVNGSSSFLHLVQERERGGGGRALKIVFFSVWMGIT